MAPSIFSARSGWLRGKTSASIEKSSAGGASGYSPSTAWLPMTTISRSLAIAPAARMTCSSSERVMHAAALGVRQQRGERRRLAQASGVLAELSRARRDFLPWPFEELLPFTQRRGRALPVTLEPSCERCAGALEQARFGGDAPRSQHMQRQASRFLHAVIGPDGRARAPARHGAQPGGAPPLAVAPHALRGRHCFVSARPSHCCYRNM